MERPTFEELQTEFEELFQDGEYTAALELAAENFKFFPKQRHLLYYWRVVALARLGETDQVLALLQEALDGGVWYGELLLRKSPSFKDLQGHPEFERLVELHQALRQQGAQQSYPLYTLRPEGRCQAGGDPCPLLLALHGNASNTQGSLGFWRPAASRGWLVAAPQSTQAIWEGAYVWDDRPTSESEMQKHYASLLENYTVDTGRVILAGHSMGGEIAIWLALKGAIPACGFIAVGPGGPFMDALEEWEPLLSQYPAPTLRGYFIVGQNDNAILKDSVLALAQALNESGVPCEVEEVEAAGHDFIPAYEAATLRALEFVLNTEDGR
ncbi:MAG: dienelactone hydrolase family protein [Anaerolineales bacterium]|nr:dienelactone hydrolase family protein [Anaerolineales bacterium]